MSTGTDIYRERILTLLEVVDSIIDKRLHYELNSIDLEKKYRKSHLVYIILSRGIDDLIRAMKCDNLDEHRFKSVAATIQCFVLENPELFPLLREAKKEERQ